MEQTVEGLPLGSQSLRGRHVRASFAHAVAWPRVCRRVAWIGAWTWQAEGRRLSVRKRGLIRNGSEHVPDTYEGHMTLACPCSEDDMLYLDPAGEWHQRVSDVDRTAHIPACLKSPVVPSDQQRPPSHLWMER